MCWGVTSQSKFKYSLLITFSMFITIILLSLTLMACVCLPQNTKQFNRYKSEGDGFKLLLSLGHQYLDRISF